MKISSVSISWITGAALFLCICACTACERNKFDLAEVGEEQGKKVEYSHKLDRDKPVRGY